MEQLDSFVKNGGDAKDWEYRMVGRAEEIARDVEIK